MWKRSTSWGKIDESTQAKAWATAVWPAGSALGLFPTLLLHASSLPQAWGETEGLARLGSETEGFAGHPRHPAAPSPPAIAEHLKGVVFSQQHRGLTLTPGSSLCHTSLTVATTHMYR